MSALVDSLLTIHLLYLLISLFQAALILWVDALN